MQKFRDNLSDIKTTMQKEHFRRQRKGKGESTKDEEKSNGIIYNKQQGDTKWDGTFTGLFLWLVLVIRRLWPGNEHAGTDGLLPRGGNVDERGPCARHGVRRLSQRQVRGTAAPALAVSLAAISDLVLPCLRRHHLLLNKLLPL